MSDLQHRSVHHNSQSGMVAIMVTLILMIVISLLVLGFAQVSRHEQRNSLDNQLSTQAYYAAESGVNDAASAIRQKLATNSPVPARKVCGDNSNYDFSTSSQLSSGVSYSCVLIDPAPPTLNYSVGSDGAVIPLISGSGQPFRTVTISWTPIAQPDGSFPANPLSGCLASAGKLPPVSGSGAWSCKYPMLRTEIVPTAILSRSSLLNNSKVNFFEPVTSGAGTASAAQGGKVIGARCVAGARPTCQVVMSGFSGAQYYMRLGALYGSTNVTISATDAAGAVGLEGAQADIDSTGSAQGVLRRVVVAVDLNDANSTRLPSAALTSGDSICKRFAVANGFFSVDQAIPGGNGNPLCDAANIAPPAPPPTVSCSGPKDVVLTLDESSSMQSIWNRGLSREDELKNLSIGFVQSITTNGKSTQVGVVSFNTTAKIEQGITNNYAAVTSAIEGMQWNYGTHYDAALAMTETAFGAARGTGVPKVMVFISDGQPDGPTSSFSAILALTSQLKKTGVTIFTIGIYKGDNGTGILEQMASSPSDYIDAGTAQQLQSFFQKISGDISC